MRASVGVTPPEALLRRSELFATLARVFSVDFEAREPKAWTGISALVAFGLLQEDALPGDVPVLAYRFEESADTCRTVMVELAATASVDARLRARTLAETGVPIDAPRLRDGIPLATDERGPLWCSFASNIDHALVAPADLGADEPLRDRFRAGRFLALLPLVELLRQTTAYAEKRRPPPRATFLFDDPNLHWPSYGYVNYERMRDHARRYAYHLAFATIPLDTWGTSRRAVRTFADAPDVLSLALHGNDHTYRELAVSRSPEETFALLDQAVRRARAFERRTGVPISRVMIPPHGLSTDASLAAMPANGIEALCRAPGWWYDWDEVRRRTTRWAMADLSPAGVPILGRHLMTAEGALDEVVLDLFLDQPAILYGHHYDLADGYEALADAAISLNAIEGMTWGSLVDLARGNVACELEGETLRADVLARRALIDLPQGVRALEVSFPGLSEGSGDRLLWNGQPVPLVMEADVGRARIDAVAGGSRGEVRLERAAMITTTPRRTVALQAVVRRTASEARDRLHPVTRRLGLGSVLASIETVYRRRARSRIGS